MSFCTLHRDMTRNAVALCGVYEGPLDTYLRENPQIKYIFLCLDADAPGKEAAERMEEPELLAMKDTYGVQAAKRFPAAPQLRPRPAEERDDPGAFQV